MPVIGEVVLKNHKVINNQHSQIGKISNFKGHLLNCIRLNYSSEINQMIFHQVFRPYGLKYECSQSSTTSIFEVVMDLFFLYFKPVV